MCEPFLVGILPKKKCREGKNIDMIETFTLQEEEILCRAARARERGHGAQAPCFELGW